jgi:transcriptional regulator GlxA family with amidase domain
MNPKIGIVIDFMHANLHRKLSLAELAESASISVSHLGHLFRTETGVSPGQYLMTLKVQRAGELLKNSIVSVKRIMFEVGFNDKSNFVRSFRKSEQQPLSD